MYTSGDPATCNSYEAECKESETSVATFHNHPQGKAGPMSPQDYWGGDVSGLPQSATYPQATGGYTTTGYEPVPGAPPTTAPSPNSPAGKGEIYNPPGTEWRKDSKD